MNEYHSHWVSATRQMDLFDEDDAAQAERSSLAGTDASEFKVNKSYANRFEHRKKAQVQLGRTVVGG